MLSPPLAAWLTPASNYLTPELFLFLKGWVKSDYKFDMTVFEPNEWLEIMIKWIGDARTQFINNQQTQRQPIAKNIKWVTY